MTRTIFRTELCNILGIEYPIVLAGMGSQGRATPPALVAAVSNAGGLGVVGGSGLLPEILRETIRDARKLTDRPIGVDLILPGKVAADAGNTRSEVRAALRERFPKHVAFVTELLENSVFNRSLLKMNLWSPTPRARMAAHRAPQIET